MRLVAVVPVLMFAAVLIPGSAAAAGTCQLVTTVDQGHSIGLAGSGFPAGGAIAITQTWSGSNATTTSPTGPQVTQRSVPADASGTFAITIDAGPGHGGVYQFSAVAAGCTATGRADAVETAGGVRPGGAGVTPPPTDTIGVAGPPHDGPILAVLLLLLGASLVGLAISLMRRQRY